MHSASWDDSFDFTEKTVAIIGSGSSAIQIVPQLQPSKSSYRMILGMLPWRAELSRCSRQTHDYDKPIQDVVCEPLNKHLSGNSSANLCLG